MVIEVCSNPHKIDTFIRLLEPYGIIESMRSGLMAMPRDSIDEIYSDLPDQGNQLN